MIVDLFAKYSDAIEAKDNLKLKFDVLFNTRVTFLSDKQLEGYFLLLQDNKLLEELEIGNVKNVLHINYVALSIPVSVLNVNDLELTDYAARVRKAKEFIVYNFSMKLRMVMADFGVDKIRNTLEKIAWLQKMSKEVMSFAVKVVPGIENHSYLVVGGSRDVTANHDEDIANAPTQSSMEEDANVSTPPVPPSGIVQELRIPHFEQDKGIGPVQVHIFLGLTILVLNGYGLEGAERCNA